MEYLEAFSTAMMVILQVIYYLCAPALAILAYRGLRQIKVTKEIAKNQAARESFKIAVDRCEFFAREVLQKEVEFRAVRPKMPELMKTKVQWKENGQFDVNGDLNKVLIECRSVEPFLNFANHLEAFAMPFTCRIADIEPAYFPTGRSFCSLVELALPAIIAMNLQSKFYAHTLTLYNIFKQRIEREAIEAEKKKLTEKSSQLKNITIKPIGTEGDQSGSEGHY